MDTENSELVAVGPGIGMKLLSGMFTPAGLLATEPLRIAQKRREGESWGDIGTESRLHGWDQHSHHQ